MATTTLPKFTIAGVSITVEAKKDAKAGSAAAKPAAFKPGQEAELAKRLSAAEIQNLADRGAIILEPMTDAEAEAHAQDVADAAKAAAEADAAAAKEAAEKAKTEADAKAAADKAAADKAAADAKAKADADAAK